MVGACVLFQVMYTNRAFGVLGQVVQSPISANPGLTQ